MNKLARLIENLPYEDLIKLQRDLKGGTLDRLIDKRIEEIRPTKSAFCPVCNAPVRHNENLTLIFGPEALRQRASFDAPDCLIYFLDRLRKQNVTEETTHSHD